MRKFNVTAVLLLVALALTTSNAGAQSKYENPMPLAQNAPEGKATAAKSEETLFDEILGGLPLVWTNEAQVPIEDGLSQSTTVADDNGFIYSIAGGLGPGPTARINQLWRYSPFDGTWTRLADIPARGRAAYGAAVHVKGSIYVFGGVMGPPGPTEISNELWIYNIGDDTWSPGANLPGPRFGSAVCLVNGRVFVAGGASTIIENQLWEYDYTNNVWITAGLASMPAGLNTFRIHGGGVDATNECYAFAGGFDGFLNLRYSVDANMWTLRAALPIGQTDPGVAVGPAPAGATDGDTRIYVIGGTFAPGAFLQIYNPTTNTWVQGARLPGLTNNTSAARNPVDNSLYVVGGFNGVTSVPTLFQLTLDGGILEGQVTSDGGTPLNNVRVRGAGNFVRNATSNAMGNYRMRITSGTYDATARTFGRVRQTANGVQVDDGATTVQNFTMPLAAVRSLSGNVTDEDGNPVRGAEVRILGTPIAPGRTDQNGNYAFAMVPEETYDVRAGGGCFSPTTREVTVMDDTVANFAGLVRRVDTFGYACEDIDADWIEADNLLPLVGDDATMFVFMPFTFHHYGIISNFLHINTNGVVNFVAPDTNFTNVGIPALPFPNGAIYAFWDDLEINRPAGIYTTTVGEAPNRKFVVEWRNATFFLPAVGFATFEVIFDEATGDVIVQYNRADMFGDGRSATVGIENKFGDVGLQYSLNQPAIAVGKAVRFYLAP